MSSYFFLGLALICLISGVIWSNQVLLVMGTTFIVGSVIVQRCDRIIATMSKRHD